MRRSVYGAVVAALVVLLAGCGNRPSEDELAAALLDPSNPVNVTGVTTDEDTVECIAKAMRDSDLSDETLRAVVDNDQTVQGDDGDRDALADLAGAVTTCVVKYAPGAAS